MSSIIGEETLQLSIGPNANAITSHLCNLHGLACTTSHSPSDDGPLCDPNVTHDIHQETYVPRVLFVDGRDCFHNRVGVGVGGGRGGRGMGTEEEGSAAWRGNIEIHHRNNHHLPSSSSSSSRDDDGYGGSMIGTFFTNDNHNNTQGCSFSSNEHHRMDALAEFQNVASVLADSSSCYSRYRADRYKRYSGRFVTTGRGCVGSGDDDGGGGRHMVWDDDDEEEEEEEEEEDMKRRRIAMEEMRWDRTEEDMQSKLDTAWNRFLHPDDSDGRSSSQPGPSVTTGSSAAPPNNGTQTTTTTSPSSPTPSFNPTSILRWSHYLMPPHPPPSLFQSPLPFPTTPSSPPNPYHHQILQSHPTGLHPQSSSPPPLTNKTQWHENILYENIRKWMERCDSIRGIHLAVDADGEEGFWGGLAESVVMEVRDECRSAVVLGVLVDGGGGGSGGSGGGGGKGEKKREYWRGEEEVYSSLRRNLNRGLTLAGLASAEAGGGCDLLVPVSLGNCFFGRERRRGYDCRGGGGGDYYSMFEASAVGALALESVTLPLRLRRGGERRRRSKVGVQSGYFQGVGVGGGGNDAFGSTDRLSHHEFLSSLRPSNRHIVLELSTSMVRGGGGSSSSSSNSNSNNHPTASTPSQPPSLHQALLQGTSIERRQLEEERNRGYSSLSSRYRRGRGRDIDPGLWMEDVGPRGGSLVPLTPLGEEEGWGGDSGGGGDRSSHCHYALSASFRPASSSSSSSGVTAAAGLMTRQSLLSSIPTAAAAGHGTVSSYTTMLMEGMGVRYRPETCVGTVVDQSLSDLIGSRPYGAGSYWKTVLCGHHPPPSVGTVASTSSVEALPILTVLGNTTRVHSHLRSRAGGMRDSLSARYSGYRKRDCTAGILPELEDCMEAMEVCDSLRDLYEPPVGGGGGGVEEGVYFEDNED